MKRGVKPGDSVSVLNLGYVRYIDHLGSDQRIVEAARVSYGSPSKGEVADQKLLEFLYRNRHTSPFEMAKVTLNIKLPIFVMRQFVRHRMQNLNEVSARYTKISDEFYIPRSWRRQDQKNKQSSIADKNWNPRCEDVSGLDLNLSEFVRLQCRTQYDVYEKMLAMGVAREMARMILPLNIYTEIYTTWDMKNMLDFLRQREDEHAQWEIREYAWAMKTICRRLFPWVIEAYEKYKWVVHEQKNPN